MARPSLTVISDTGLKSLVTRMLWGTGRQLGASDPNRAGAVMEQSHGSAAEQEAPQATHVARADDDHVMPALLDFADNLDPGFAADQLGGGGQTSLLGGIDKMIERLPARPAEAGWPSKTRPLLANEACSSGMSRAAKKVMLADAFSASQSPCLIASATGREKLLESSPSVCNRSMPTSTLLKTDMMFSDRR